MLIIGHRGARGEAPENTLSGFRYLHSLGIRAVEFDIHVSLDNELVVIHDAEVQRTSQGFGSVHELTAQALFELDVCHKYFPHWQASDGVPRLTDVLALLDDFSHIELEVKARTPEHEAVVRDKLPQLWEHHQLAGRARTTSFNPRYLHSMLNAAPHIPRGFLFEADFAGDAIQIAQAVGASSLGPHQSRCSAELVAQAHDAGLLVSTWTVNDAERAQALATMGVDGLITDLPTQALRWFT
jgi:glycerophosphoryl diester phosphodiesterase